MKRTLTYSVYFLLSTLVLSCQFNGSFGFGINGDGNVVKEDRVITENFNSIEVGRGLDVYLTQNSQVKITVEADKNLHENIVTEVKNNTLKIYAEDNIASSKSKKVLVSFTDIEGIEAWGGSDVYSTNTIKTENLRIKTTSGSDMELNIDVDVADCEATSGSDLRLEGNTNKLFAEATSGSDIKANNLIANICNARATSGADVIVYTVDKLHASASSGGDVKYYGNPKNVQSDGGVSGSVIKK